MIISIEYPVVTRSSIRPQCSYDSRWCGRCSPVRFRDVTNQGPIGTGPGDPQRQLPCLLWSSGTQKPADVECFRQLYYGQVQ